MKFREVRDRVVTRKCTPPLSEHHADPSPLLDRNATVYLTQMRDNIKNSFTDKLSFMKSNARIYDFEQNPKVLKATSHLTGVPALLPPQVSFQVADFIREGKSAEWKQNENPAVQFPPLQKRSIHDFPTSSVYEPIDFKFRHRTGVKELEGWLRKKLETPPKNETDCVEYKNQIMWLGMKELIRMVKIRCEDEGALIEAIWEQTWKICKDIILFLSNNMNDLRKNFNNELQIIEKLYESKMKEDSADTSRFTHKIQELETQLRMAAEEARVTTRNNRELKTQLNEERTMRESFQNVYFRVLEQNIVLQAGDVEKREWVKTLYKSVKQYKAKISSKMKTSIRNVAMERADRDGEQLNLEDIEQENFEMEKLLKLNQPPPKQYENALVSTDPVVNAHVLIQTEPIIVTVKEVETMTEQIEEQKSNQPNNRISIEEQIIPLPRVFQQTAVNTEHWSENQVQSLSVSIEQRTEGRSRLDLEHTLSPIDNAGEMRREFRMSLQHEEFEPVVQTQYEEAPTDRNQRNSITGTLKISSKQTQPPKSIERQISLKEKSQKKLAPTNGGNSNTAKDRRASRISQKSVGVALKKFGSSKEKDTTEERKKQKERTETDLDPIDLEGITRQARKVNTSRPSLRASNFNRNYAANMLSSDKRSVYVSGLERKSFNETYTYMRGLLKRDKPSFELSVSRRRSFMRLETLVREEQRIYEYEVYSQRLVVKFEKINFEQLSRIKNNKSELGAFKELLRSCASIPLQTEKNMQAAIEKHIVPVLMDEIKNYKKMRSASGFNRAALGEYIRQLSPFPVIVLRKFTQKYGVKMLALKNLRQILRYAEAMRSRSPREELIYQLLFTEPFTCCDMFLAYITAEAFLDPMMTSLSSFESNYKQLERQQVTIDLLEEVASKFLTRHQATEYLDQMTQEGTDVNQFSLRMFSWLSSHRNLKLQPMAGMFELLSSQSNTLKFECWSAFICSLDLESSLEKDMLKSFLSFCNVRTCQNKYQLTEDKFNTMVMRTECIQWEIFQRSLDRFASLYTDLVDKQLFKQYSLREDSNIRLLRQVEGLLDSSQSLSAGKKAALQFGWTYLQYLNCRNKLAAVHKEILGTLSLLTTKQLSALNHFNREAFEIQLTR